MLAKYAGDPGPVSVPAKSRSRGHILKTKDRSTAASSSRLWGRFPELSLIVAVGLLLVATADTTARVDEPWAEPLFWMGLLLLFAPIAFRLAANEISRRERICLVVLLGVGLYFAKVLHSPTYFTFYDEFIHWRTANDILETNRFFAANPILPVSSLYPGLESVVTAVVSLSGLSIYDAAIIVLCLARVVLVLSLFLFYEAISHSPKVAGIAALLYIANPNFVFLDAQFAYETLALPLMAVVLYTRAKEADRHFSNQTGLLLVSIFGTGAVVVTHHVTAFVLVAFMIIWAIMPGVLHIASSLLSWYAGDSTTRQFVAAVLGGPGSRQLRREYVGSLAGAILTTVATFTWLVYVAAATVNYIAPTLENAAAEFLKLIAGEASLRQLFQSQTGRVAPVVEQLVGYAATLLVLILLVPGLLVVVRNYRRNMLVLTLAVPAIAYPATLLARLTLIGVQTTGRTWAFLFVGIAFVLTLSVVRYFLAFWTGRLGRVLFACGAAVIFMGNVISGWSPTERLPGPYMVSAQGRSIETQGISTAYWTSSFLGQGNRITTDRINALLQGSYGMQQVVLPPGEDVDVTPVFFSKELGEAELAILSASRIRYVIVDQRLSTGLPVIGVYYDAREPDAHQHAVPMSPDALGKFDGADHVSRIYDSGSIVIYDVKDAVR